MCVVCVCVWRKLRETLPAAVKVDELIWRSACRCAYTLAAARLDSFVHYYLSNMYIRTQKHSRVRMYIAGGTLTAFFPAYVTAKLCALSSAGSSLLIAFLRYGK